MSPLATWLLLSALITAAYLTLACAVGSWIATPDDDEVTR